MTVGKHGRDACVVAGLALLAGLAFASHVRTGGLYYDDWSALAIQRYPTDPGTLGAVHDYIAGGPFVSRPGMAVLLALSNAGLGSDGTGHLVLAVLLALAVSVLFFAFLRAVGVPTVHAAVMAGLVLLFPWSDTTRLWSTVAFNNVAIALFLGGLLAALRGLREPGRRGLAWHGLALACYGVSVLVHELAVALVLLTGPLYAMRAPIAVAARRWALDVAVVAAAALVLRDSGTRTITGLDDSVGHARTIVDQAATLLAAAMSPFTLAPRWLMGGALLAVLAAGAVTWLHAGRRSRPGDVGRWLAVTLAGIVVVGLAYLPYLPAGSWYVPLNPGQGNRVNALAALGYVATVYGAAALAAAVLRRVAPAARWLPAALLALYVAGVGIAWMERLDTDKADWARSARIQDAVLSTMHEAVPKPPPATTIYAFGFPTTSAPGVPIFLWITDLSGAVRVTYGDRSLTGYPMPEGTAVVCGDTGVHPQNNGYTEAHATPYAATLFFDATSGRTAAIRSRRDCERAARVFVAGPGRFAGAI